MRLNREHYQLHQRSILKVDQLDLSKVAFFTPYGLVATSLLCIQYRNIPGYSIVLPANEQVRTYLQRSGFTTALKIAGFHDSARVLDSLQIAVADSPNLLELVYCRYRDDLTARLGKILKMLEEFGMDPDSANLATSLVAEVADNVFEHNDFMNNEEMTGALITAQRYPQNSEIEIAVADCGRGFSASMSSYRKNLTSVEALRLSLNRGVTGRMGETRGKGLDFVKENTLGQFRGELTMQSYDGKISVIDPQTIRSGTVPTIRGSIVDIVLKYK